HRIIRNQAFTMLKSNAAKQEKTFSQLESALPKALDLIHHSLDRGYPVLAWDIFFPEFGLIYGYDDEQRRLYADECGRRDTLPYENLGRSVLEEIFVLAIDESFEVNQHDRLHNAMLMILEHYDGKENENPSDSVKGIRAYEVWCDAFRGGNVEPNGNAYNIAIIMNGRKYAAEFLKEVQTNWPDIEDADNRIRLLLGEAVELYTEISSKLTTLHEMFPFPEGGEPNTPTKSQQTIELLQIIKTLEIKGVETLRNILDLLQ
ncbi:MAG: sigma-70 family polymerase sigma factor, partial [Bacilli bacterium]|nr:sigma-70 family polymerase sigma factor [Bacilli bacterium]